MTSITLNSLTSLSMWPARIIPSMGGCTICQE
jgi:hypothetical protein